MNCVTGRRALISRLPYVDAVKVFRRRAGLTGARYLFLLD